MKMSRLDCRFSERLNVWKAILFWAAAIAILTIPTSVALPMLSSEGMLDSTAIVSVVVVQAMSLAVGIYLIAYAKDGRIGYYDRVPVEN